MFLLTRHLRVGVEKNVIETDTLVLDSQLKYQLLLAIINLSLRYNYIRKEAKINFQNSNQESNFGATGQDLWEDDRNFHQLNPHKKIKRKKFP
jgi:hypothetical protein